MSAITFGSVCSGIEAASVAWHPLGWRAAWLAEIEPFPCAVLSHHYPDVPNLGDMNRIPQLLRNGEIPAPDVFCGGTPCQAFSVAGLRNSLDDARGNLSLKFCDIANEIDIQRSAAGFLPAVVFWENVPGVLTTKDNAFGCLLGQLAGEDCPLVPPGGKWTHAGAVLGPQRAIAWRILDAQYFGVAQRRRRVFVVASAREGFDPAAVLFEFDGVRRDTAPRREQGQDAAGTLASRTDGGGFPGTDEACSGYVQPVHRVLRGGNTSGAIDVAACLTAKGQRIDFEVETFAVQPVAGTLTATYGEQSGQDLMDMSGGLQLAPIAFSGKDYGADASVDLAPTMRAMDHTGSHANAGGQLAVCITGDVTHTLKAEGFDASEDGTGRGQPIINVPIGCDGAVDGPVPPLMARSSRGGAQTLSPGHQTDGHMIGMGMAVRRLTPRECERLQAFPDNYTMIVARGKPAADGPRYKALGNSWAVSNVRWIGQRIDQALRSQTEKITIRRSA